MDNFLSSIQDLNLLTIHYYWYTIFGTFTLYLLMDRYINKTKSGYLEFLVLKKILFLVCLYFIKKSCVVISVISNNYKIFKDINSSFRPALIFINGELSWDQLQLLISKSTTPDLIKMYSKLEEFFSQQFHSSKRVFSSLQPRLQRHSLKSRSRKPKPSEGSFSLTYCIKSDFRNIFSFSDLMHPK